MNVVSFIWDQFILGTEPFCDEDEQTVATLQKWKDANAIDETLPMSFDLMMAHVCVVLLVLMEKDIGKCTTVR